MSRILPQSTVLIRDKLEPEEKRSLFDAPASCSRRIPMICSSVNRFLFIVRLHLLGRTLNLSGGNLQWQVTASPAAADKLAA